MKDSRPNDDDAASPGWYDDPAGSGDQRYWDGSEWTHHTSAPAGDGAAPSQQGSRRGGLIAAASVLLVLVGIGVGLLAIGAQTTESPPDAATSLPLPSDPDGPPSESPAPDGTAQNDLDAAQPSDAPADDIEVQQREGAVYFYYALRVEAGEEIEDVPATQLDGARRVSETLSSAGVDADAYCVGNDLVIVAVPDDAVDLFSLEDPMRDALRGDFELATTTTDLADFSGVALVQCQAREGQIVRQGGSGTFP